MSNLRRILYLSQSTAPMNKGDLLALLYLCRTVNAKLGVTGMMLYSAGNFMQVLEGRHDHVGGLMDRIKRDARHMNVLTLVDEAATERCFGDWNMGLLDIQNLRPIDLDRLTLVIRAAQTGTDLTKPGRTSLALLRDFTQQLAPARDHTTARAAS